MATLRHRHLLIPGEHASRTGEIGDLGKALSERAKVGVHLGWTLPTTLGSTGMSDQAIETLFEEERRYPPPPAFAAQANAKPDVYDIPFEEFWEREGRDRVTWFEPFTSLLEWELPYAKWYGGGRINVAYNCLDRHVEAGLGDRVAYYYEGEPVGEHAAITYRAAPRRGRSRGERPEGARRREGHARRHLHGHGAGASRRDARVRSARCAAHRRLRRLFGGVARRSAQRHALRGAPHAGRELQARDDRPAEAKRRRGARVVPSGASRSSSASGHAATCR